MKKWYTKSSPQKAKIKVKSEEGLLLLMAWYVKNKTSKYMEV